MWINKGCGGRWEAERKEKKLGKKKEMGREGEGKRNERREEKRGG